MIRLSLVLLLASCSYAESTPKPTPNAPSPMEHNAIAIAIATPTPEIADYPCICNKQDIGRCQNVYIHQSEQTYYVNFTFQYVTILKRATECRLIQRKGFRR